MQVQRADIGDDINIEKLLRVTHISVDSLLIRPLSQTLTSSPWQLFGERSYDLLISRRDDSHGRLSRNVTRIAFVVVILMP